MTALQLQYRNMVETQRSNLVKERQAINELDETKRHNVATELETNRANVVKELELHRSNVTKEKETERHNRQEELLGAGKELLRAGVKILPLV